MPATGCPENLILSGANSKVLFKPANTRLCFDATATGVDVAGDEISFKSNHGFLTGDKVLYTEDSLGTAPTGLTTGTSYFVIKVDSKTIQLAATLADANAGTPVTISAAGTGDDHLIEFEDYLTEAALEMWSVNFTKTEIDTPIIGDKVNRVVGGTLSGSGSITAYFTAGETDAAKRIAADAILVPDFGTTRLKIYYNYASPFGPTQTDGVNQFVEFDALITSFNTSGSNDEALKMELNFRVNDGSPLFQLSTIA